MKKLREKKVNLFGKKVSVFAIALMSLALVSAALLSYYGVITGMATVSQSVVLLGSPTFSFNAQSFVAGKSFTDCGFSVKNNADVEAPVYFYTTCKNSGTGQEATNLTDIDWIGIDGPRCDGIVTKIYGVLELSGKSDCYAEGSCTLGTTPKAKVYYTIVGDKFWYKVVSDNIVVDAYTLVYYPDIGGYESSHYTGYVILVDEDIGSLPIDTDLNKVSKDYCTNGKNPSGVNCYGAKLWLVPTEDINVGESKLNGWKGDHYLFETDLISYTKTVDDSNIITLPAGNHFDFCVDNNFALNLVGDTYNITTMVRPVTA